jgi:pyruvate dehydrogenase E2 component (dihydrolipoamide acetyltransferase)
MTDIVMPKLSDSMEQGMIISWFKSTGDQIEAGDELLEIETDKSTAPYVAESSGTLEILAAVGTTVAVGEPIGRIGSASELPRPAESPEGSSAQPIAAAVPEMPSAAEVLSRIEQPGSVAPDGNGQATGDLKATPLARRVAAAHNVALEGVMGTGPLGRITRADVLGAAGIALPARHTEPPAPSPVASRPAAPQPGLAGGRRQELSRVQQLIATRMAEAKSTVPHFQLQTEADMTAALALREDLKAVASENQQVPSINDVIVKAAAIALRSHPLANGSYTDGAFELHDAINIGVAVAANDALVVPIVFDADTKSLGQIAAEIRRLAASVRDGSFSPRDLEGGTFTVSNLGMFGMTAITPVINAPQAAILGVGTLRPTLASVDGEIIDRSLLTLTLSCDHRILYGADAARFLAEIRDLLEAPLRFAL